MSYQIIKQPDGKFCIFSSIGDEIIAFDANKEELVEFLVHEKRERIETEVYDILECLDRGIPPYRQFTLTYDEAIRTHIRNHGALKADDPAEGETL